MYIGWLKTLGGHVHRLVEDTRGTCTYGTSHSKLHDVRWSTESCQMTVRVLIDDRLGWVLVGDRSLYSIRSLGLTKTL